MFSTTTERSIWLTAVNQNTTYTTWYCPMFRCYFSFSFPFSFTHSWKWRRVFGKIESMQMESVFIWTKVVLKGTASSWHVASFSPLLQLCRVVHMLGPDCSLRRTNVCFHRSLTLITAWRLRKWSTLSPANITQRSASTTSMWHSDTTSWRKNCKSLWRLFADLARTTHSFRYSSLGTVWS